MWPELKFEVVGNGRKDWKKINQSSFLSASVSDYITVIIFGNARINGEGIFPVVGIVYCKDP